MTFSQPRVGQRLRELRERAGLSRAQLSTATGVHPSAILRLENGDDVRLSSYFPIVDYFLERDPKGRLQAERVVALALQLGDQTTEDGDG